MIGPSVEPVPMPRPGPWGSLAMSTYAGLAQDDRGMPGEVEIDFARRRLGFKRRSLEWRFFHSLLAIVIDEAQSARSDALEAMRERRGKS